MEDEKSVQKVTKLGLSPPPSPPHSSLKPRRPPPDQRWRYSVELRPGETTVVSWKKLFKESNKGAAIPVKSGLPSVLDSSTTPAQATQSVDELKDAPPTNRFSSVIEKIECLYKGQQTSDEEELNNVPDDDEYDTKDSFIDDTELNDYFQIDNSGTKYNGFFVNKGKLERLNKSASSSNLAPQKRKKKELKTHDKLDQEQFPSKLVKVQNLESKEVAKNTQIAGNKSSRLAQTSATPTSEHLKRRGDIGGLKPKGKTLEHAIQDLEKVVARMKSPTMEIPEVDIVSHGIKRRLPWDIKQKLAEVARLGKSSQGKISKELISRLMGILGDMVQVRTLKRHLKEMAEIDLLGKKQKADRLEEVKNDVIRMIGERMAIEHAGSTDHFLEEGQQVKYRMDEALEDKISDLYELYVEGMDEDREPQPRKLHAELAELWPDGAMDNKRVKRCIDRARERKKQFYIKHKYSKVKRKRNSPSINKEAAATGENAQSRVTQDSSCLAVTSPDKSTSNAAGTDQHLSLPSKTSTRSSDHLLRDRPKPKRMKGSVTAGIAMKRSGEKLSRKKRKTEI